MKTGHRTSTSPNHCGCCGTSFQSRLVNGIVRCKSCDRPFHAKCFLKETGINDIVKEKCVVCLCGVIERPYPVGVLRNPLAAKFLRDGFSVVSLSSDSRCKQRILKDLEKFHANADRYFSGFMRSYETELEVSGKAPSLEGGYTNFRQRGEGRYELISDQIQEEVLSIISGCDVLMRTINALLTSSDGNKHGGKLMSCGCFYSLPGSERQVLHTDGPSLSSVEDLFPYAVNVFIPLVPMDRNNGTEFFPGSHKTGWNLKKQKQEPVVPTVPLGKALLFDYRVLHRGMGNLRGTSRPCYYATFSRPWYEDKYNFSSKRYKTSLHILPYLLEKRTERGGLKRSRSL
ncbi:putative ADP-ribosylation factor-like protein 3A [Trypanosoma vivax]|nr:putative ADP-ribosylation factor-like protein 3A [Trypanosoma vivax]